MEIDWVKIKRNLDGTASKEEREEYAQWLAEDKSHHAYVQKIKGYYKSHVGYKDFSKEDIDQKFLNFDHLILKSNRKKFYRRSFSIAASVLLIFGAAIWVFYDLNLPDEVVLSNHGNVSDLGLKSDTLKNNSVQLIIDDRGVYDMSSREAKENLRENNIKLASNKIDYTNNKKSAKVDSVEVEIHTLKVPRGKDWNITLSDGTKVYLNADSELKFPKSFVEGKDRVVSLVGEAYFEVTSDKKSKFIVETQKIDVTVYGTKFNINTQREGFVETVLMEGSVSVKSHDGADELKMIPNQMALYSSHKADIAIREVNAADYVLWTKGMFLFDELPLKDILNKLSLWYDVEIEYQNEKIKSKVTYCRIPRTKTIEPILDAIARNGSMEYEIKGRTVYIK